LSTWSLHHELPVLCIANHDTRPRSFTSDPQKYAHVQVHKMFSKRQQSGMHSLNLSQFSPQFSLTIYFSPFCFCVSFSFSFVHAHRWVGRARCDTARHSCSALKSIGSFQRVRSVGRMWKGSLCFEEGV
jgi:hypothetical protein